MRKTGHLRLKNTIGLESTCKIRLVKQKEDLGHRIARPDTYGKIFLA